MSGAEREGMGGETEKQRTKGERENACTKRDTKVKETCYYYISYAYNVIDIKTLNLT